MTAGPLAGIRVVEIAGIGPGPFAAMVLADLGADVVRVDRARPAGFTLPPPRPGAHDVLTRSRRSLAVDLRQPAAVEVVLDLAAWADVLIEGFRPGVAERLGIGPQVCLELNPALVYGRMTGYGQEGPLAGEAGHDLNYLAVAGVLGALGSPGEPPPVPLNVIADFGGGGMLLVVGVLAALLERSRSGRGQVVDAAMVDGAALLTAMLHGMASLGLWQDARRSNLLDGGMPFYRCYACADGYVAVGALEEKFYEALLRGVGLDPAEWPQGDVGRHAELAEELTRRFSAADGDHWAAVFAGADACVTVVQHPSQAPAHPHLVARGTFMEVDGVVQPAPAPRFSRTGPPSPSPPRAPGADSRLILSELGYADARIEELVAAGVVAAG